ncbi:hypothetical protein [Winogradskyella ursingii]|uniref:hypothetical protein n=1 Tax=Winogradskyella ursingii TaxID=2686079 RepID=UPI0015CCE282|nr:hypothetical protein [Winogradskyella ursingii]
MKLFIKIRITKVSFLFFLISFLSFGYVNAHISDGHVVIERKAYALLKAQKPKGSLPNGETMFQFLVANGFIKDNDEANSAYPDLDLGRQFLSDRQIYHFMASSHYVMEALRKYDDVEMQKAYILKKALPDCLNMVYTLLRETIDNPVGASEAGRGIYVLMHAITDSYSREHTIRDSKTFDLINIKSWQLSRLFWPKAAKQPEPKKEDYVETMVFLHSIEGLADEEWEYDGGELKPEAIAAANAIKELLVTIYIAKNANDNIDGLITAYMSKHFKPKIAVTENDNFRFRNDNTVLKLSYDIGYANNQNVLKLDRYPLFSHMLYAQNGLNDTERSSFGYEVGYHVTPRAAFSSTSFFQRLPYGFTMAVNENTRILKNTNFFESLQLKATAKVAIYLPLRNLVLEPKIGYGLTPLYEQASNSGFITGFDIAFNLGRDNNRARTKRFAIGYEYDSSGLHSYNSILLKIGYNSWQGRTIKK